MIWGAVAGMEDCFARTDAADFTTFATPPCRSPMLAWGHFFKSFPLG